MREGIRWTQAWPQLEGDGDNQVIDKLFPSDIVVVVTTYPFMLVMGTYCITASFEIERYLWLTDAFYSALAKLFGNTVRMS